MFRRPIQRYGLTPEPATPYQRAAQVWDDRIGSARVQAKNWRMMSFGGLGLALCLGGALAWQSVQSRVTPYVVQVDKFGAVQAVTPAVQNYVPTDAEMAWYLGRFITDVRSLSSDPCDCPPQLAGGIRLHNRPWRHCAQSIRPGERSLQSHRPAHCFRARSTASCACPTIRSR